VKPVDFTEGGSSLSETLATIRKSFGGDKPVFVHFTIHLDRISFVVRGLQSPYELNRGTCELTGLRDEGHGSLESEAMRKRHEKSDHIQPTTEADCFTLDEIDWSKLPDMRKAAIKQMGNTPVAVEEIKINRRPGFIAQPIQVQFTLGYRVDGGFVQFDTRGNQLRFQPLMPNTGTTPDMLEPENTGVILNAIQNDFGPETKLMEIELRKQAAYIKASPPAHPEQSWEYRYSLRDGMKISSDTSKSLYTDATMITAGEVAALAPRIPELEQKAVKLLGGSQDGVERVTFYRYGPLATSKDLLVEVRIADGPNIKSDAAVYDSSGRLIRMR